MRANIKAMSHLMLVLTLTLFTYVEQSAAAPDAIPGATTVTAEELIDLVNRLEALVIIDSRTRGDYAKGHIEGAVNLPDTLTTAATLAANIPSKTHPVLFYCNGVRCGRSIKAVKIALAEGYKEVYWFRGGWEEWRAKGFPIVINPTP